MILSPDTNLLVYSLDQREPVKRAIALDVLSSMSERGSDLMALQVAGELYAVLSRRLKLPSAVAHESVTSMLRLFGSFSYDEQDVHVALTLAARGTFSYWGALLVSSAERAGCRYLVSEDMQDGFRYEQLEIVSPFAGTNMNPRLVDLLGR